MSVLAQIQDESAGIVPGSLPLPDPKRERYAGFCALGYSNSEAGRLAGYALGSGTHNKARKAKAVQDRIWYLAGDTLALIRDRRAMLNAKYLRLIHAEPKEEEAAGDVVDEKPSLVGRVVEYDADGVIKGSRYDPKIGLEAAAQFRQLNGLDEPKVSKTELTGKDGGPIKTQHAADLSDEELAAIATGKV